ncbi:SusC/RagA family TonB-linked outer membrane protein [Siphonobacter sp. BAB-5385]|uniref:SusC/RagA family TonB-linked outer membrane protein n=2 Tax=unclassified Siphonobacter TaxID=2635712 RepID=UPI000B9DE513|nr:SusC/RagA family TonB-linked outer membrane protein [Siphonobacter sp. BAB-5385]OZI06397.1 SusC/RagA family TonB-linked outer membrane protein [Siphonobacter sp. BAB-5385]
MRKSVLPGKLLFYLLFAWTALAGSVSAQVQLQGKVSDANGSGLPFITVKLSSASTGTTTNASGTYQFTPSLKPGRYTLVFSGVGYKSQQKSFDVNASQNAVTLDATLEEDVLGLDEVVVTGTMGATSKRELGNSIATVGAKDLQFSAAPSLDAALQGKLSGAQITQNSGNPAGGISIRMRGPSTIVGSSDPLYIVDGVIVNNDSRQLIDLGGYSQNRLVDINPADIDRIEVIKGAAAAAIYGSRANNGVVQIFTKKGKEGKPSITFSTQFRVSQLRKKMAYNEYPFAFANTTPTDETQVPVTRYDYQDKIFQNAFGTENYLSLSGGTANTKYFVSGSNYYNQGIIKSTDFNRNGIRLRIQQKIGNKATISAGSNYVYSSSKEIPNGGISEAYGALTGFIFSNNSVNPEPDPVTGVYPSTAPVSVVRRTNPLEAINRFKFGQRTSRIISDFNFNLKPIEGLNIDYTVGIDNYTQSATAYIPPKNTTPTYDQGLARRADATVFQINNDLNVSYNTKVNDWLTSTSGIGGTIQYDRTLTFGATAQQLGAFGETINNGTIIAMEFRSERSILGAFAQQSFGIKDRYFITGAARVDASSVYGIDNRWQFFPKVSGSYVVSNEKFWSEGTLGRVINSFKLRAAWGQSGNLTAIGAYDRFTNYSPVIYGGQTGYISPAQFGNFTVKPERQTETEIGADLSLLNDRVSVEFSYFNKSVADLILNRTLAPTTGFNNRLINVGSMTNKGFEVMVKAVPVQTSGFRWITTLTYTSNKNTVNGVEGNGVLPFAGGFSQVAAVNGYPLGAYYSTFFARNPDGSLLLTAPTATNPNRYPQRERGTQLANGQYTVQRDANGQPTGTILSKVIGDPNPWGIVGFTNEFEIGKFNFRMQWDGMLGFEVFNFTRRVGERDLYASLKGYEPELRGDVPKGTSAALFSIFENYIEDGSFVKLREISASYVLTPKLWKMQNLRLTLIGRNLLSIDNYSGWDPETNAAGQDNAVRGFDFVEVPIPRSFLFGVSVNF